MYKILAPKHHTLEALLNEPCRKVLSDEAMAFIEALSQALINQDQFKPHADMISLGFWLRKSNLRNITLGSFSQSENLIRLPRGLAFHITPSNIDTMFVYSLVISMLAGNLNIVKLPSKDSPHKRLLVKLFNTIASAHPHMAKNFLLIQYDSSEADITKQMSELCDVRIIWGGDNTVRTIRQMPIKPTATEITFADKFSLCLINTKKFVEEKNKDNIIKGFYNDAFWAGQMACSSPRMLVWHDVNQSADKAQQLFWQSLQDYCQHKPTDVTSSAVIDKVEVSQLFAAQGLSRKIVQHHPMITRILLDDISHYSSDRHCGSGLFYEVSIQTLEQMYPIFNRKIQTLSVYGYELDTIRDVLSKPEVKGVDRVVPIGSSLDFSNQWDGYNLMNELTREITINIGGNIR